LLRPRRLADRVGEAPARVGTVRSREQLTDQGAQRVVLVFAAMPAQIAQEVHRAACHGEPRTWAIAAFSGLAHRAGRKSG